MAKLTRAIFAQQAAYIASNCASWSGDVLTLPEKVREPMNAESVRRFLAHVREHCDIIERWAAEEEAVVTPKGREALSEKEG